MVERALEGIDVIDLGQVYHGPYASLLLSYLGANVIKVEPPFGEQLRTRVEEGEEPAELVMMNSSKKGITLNLKSEEGKDLFKDLIRDADVLVENFSTGTMESLGLGYDTLSEINEELIHAHGSGYGDHGPYKDYPAMDLTVQAMTGVMSVTGYEDQPPVKAGIAVADFMGGVHLAVGILAALVQRGVTGEGQYVEESMHDTVFPTMSSAVASYFNGSDAPQRTGNRHSGLARCPYNVYEANDGHVAIFCSTNAQWETLLDIMGREDAKGDPRFGSNVDRVEHMEEVDSMIESWTRTKPKGDIADLLLDRSVPAAPVKTVEDVIYDEHLEEREMSVELEHPKYGEIRVPGLPVRLSESEYPDIEPSPTKGQDNDEVFTVRLGLSQSEIEQLREDGAI